MGRLKTVGELTAEIGRKLERSFVEEIVGAGFEWPHGFALGRPSKAELLRDLERLDVLTQTLRRWERELGVQVSYETREAGGIQRVPSRVEVPSLDVAAELVGTRTRVEEPWQRVLDRTRKRRAALDEGFARLTPHERAKILRAKDTCDELEFELLLVAGAWFAQHEARGLTPRQVPLPGIDAKWLNNKGRQSLICLLAGRDVLELRDQPGQVSFAYLDPVHLAHGGRRYDSWIEGDVLTLPYTPTIVIIVENKDSYLDFPQVEGGVCIFGSGKAGMALVVGMPLVREAERVVYWGDLDADGFQILNGYRERGVDCMSILMDEEALQRYGRYGTNLEKDHRTPIDRERLELPLLTDSERSAYQLITSPDHEGYRRIEQERIPLDAALSALRGVVLQEGHLRAAVQQA